MEDGYLQEIPTYPDGILASDGDEPTGLAMDEVRGSPGDATGAMAFRDQRTTEFTVRRAILGQRPFRTSRRPCGDDGEFGRPAGLGLSA